jgi:nucleotide-binding universal stress UspA family protein
MIQLRSILVPTDFSEQSNPAIRYGCALAQKFDSTLHLVNVVEDVYPLIPESGMVLPTAVTHMHDLRLAADKGLEQRPPAEWSQGLTITREVLVGNAANEIIRYARNKQIDLVVIGTHGRTGLMHVILGSVAEKVVRRAPCPVLTVRPDGHQFLSE